MTGRQPEDDRDHYGNKRVDLAGPLFERVFRTHWVKLMKDTRVRADTTGITSHR